MVYQRYVTRKGKKHGPYYYASTRDSKGKVKSIYLGSNLEKAKAKEIALQQQKAHARSKARSKSKTRINSKVPRFVFKNVTRSPLEFTSKIPVLYLVAAILLVVVVGSQYYSVTGLTTFGIQSHGGSHDGAFVENTTWGSDLTGISDGSSILGDFDLDGDMDLLLVGGRSAANPVALVYINNGTAFDRNSAWDAALVGLQDGASALGDFDNDGDLDLVTFGRDSGLTLRGYVYTNSGTAFVRNSAWDADLMGMDENSIALGDIDLDGDLDLVVAGDNGTTSNVLHVYTNNGSSFSRDVAWESSLVAFSSDLTFHPVLALGDGDGDGDLDLVASDEGASAAYVYQNNGTGFARNSTWDSNMTDLGPSGAAWADFDLDGSLDLILTSNEGLQIYMYNGSGFRQNITWDAELQSIDAHDSDLAVADFDNDGDIDLVFSGNLDGSDDTRVYINNGTSFSQNSTWDSNLTEIRLNPSFGVGDFDGDGSIDLVHVGFNTAGQNNAGIFINNITNANTAPSAPSSGFSSSYLGSSLTLSWDNGTDVETSNNSLYYNLRVGTTSGGNDVVSGVYGGSSNPTAGYFGNMMQRQNISLTVANLTYYWSVQTIDAGLANSSWSVEQVYTFAPVISAFLVNGSSSDFFTSSAGVNLTANVSDSNLNTSNVNITILNASSWEYIQSAFSTCTFLTGSIYECNYTTTVSTEGNYTFNVSAYDNSSNSTNSASGIYFLYDSSTPVVDGFSINGSITYQVLTSQSLNFSVNITDVNLNVSRVNITVTNATDDSYIQSVLPADCVNVVGNTWTCNYTTSISVDGNYSFNVTAVDLVGNSNSSASGVVVNVNTTVDSSAPVLQGLFINGSSADLFSATNAFNLSANVTDANLNTSRVNFTIYNASSSAYVQSLVATCVLSSGSTYACNYTTTVSSEGNYTFNVTAVDNTSNSNESAAGIYFVYDATAPTVTITPIITTTDTTPDLEATTSEASTCQYKNAASGSYADMSTTGSTTHSQTLSTLTIGSDYRYFVQCNDSTGNIANSSIAFSIVSSAASETKNETLTDPAADTQVPLNTTSNVNVTLFLSTSVNGTVSSSEYSTNPVDQAFPKDTVSLYAGVTLDTNLVNALDYALVDMYYTTGSLSSLDESDLVAYSYNATSGAWVLQTSTVNTTANYVRINTTHFTIFGIGGDQPASSSSSSTTVTTAGGGSPTGQLPFFITILAPEVTVEIANAVVTQSFKFEVENKGNQEVNGARVVITDLPVGITARVSPSSTTLGVGDSITFTVRLNVQPDVAAGSYPVTLSVYNSEGKLVKRGETSLIVKSIAFKPASETEAVQPFGEGEQPPVNMLKALPVGMHILVISSIVTLLMVFSMFIFVRDLEIVVPVAIDAEMFKRIEGLAMELGYLRS